MDPQIALQLYVTIAKISATILALYMAMIIFALRDEILSQLILRHRLPYFTVLLTCCVLSLATIVSVLELLVLDLEVPYEDSRASSGFLLLCSSVFLMLYSFWVLISEKKRLSNEKKE